MKDLGGTIVGEFDKEKGTDKRYWVIQILYASQNILVSEYLRYIIILKL